ncbi:fructose-1,6-bisphosphatase class 1 [bacterium BMS3Abin05]|nr:fructose-1,6-bisphosphatase class 1 [bacterium BMS3Abin05]
MIKHGIMTLQRHIMEQERKFPMATGEFSGLMSDLAVAAKILARSVNKAGLIDVLGFTGDENIFGEEVKKLDILANETIIHALDHSGHLCVMASEESDGLIEIPDYHPVGKYVMLFDPLDGSSNIDVNISIGTIFSIFRRVTPSGKGTLADVLQQGNQQVAAGYVLYGSSTMFVYSTGQGLHGFTYDPSIGEFLLSNEDMKIPEHGPYYSTNEGYYHRWSEGMRRFVSYLKEEDPATGRPYSLRYIGSLVADFHRNLLYGGIFLYPTDTLHPKGKLRLLYEANSLAFLVEQAGGLATDGVRRILDIQPEDLGHRVPLIIGSKKDVELAMDFLRES